MLKNHAELLCNNCCFKYKLQMTFFVSLNIFRMQRIRCRQKKYRAGLRGSDESSEPDAAGMLMMKTVTVRSSAQTAHIITLNV